MAEQLTFQLIGGDASSTPPLHYIDRIAHADAQAFVEQWHYSKRMPTGKNIAFGLWHQGELYAVIVYGIGVNPYQAQFLGVKSVVEIKRMCRREPKQEYQLSRFIRLTMKLLRQFMRFDAVVAFADPDHGHAGTVYKAAGFVHEGLTHAEWHLQDANGQVRHRRFAFRAARRQGIPIAEAREQLGVTRTQTAPKHRWVLRLAKNAD